MNCVLSILEGLTQASNVSASRGAKWSVRSRVVPLIVTATCVSCPLKRNADGPICGGGGDAWTFVGPVVSETSTFRPTSHKTSYGSEEVTIVMFGSFWNSERSTPPESMPASSNFQYATSASKFSCQADGAIL